MPTFSRCTFASFKTADILNVKLNKKNNRSLILAMQTGYNEQVYYSQWNQTKMYLTMSGIPLTGILLSITYSGYKNGYLKQRKLNYNFYFLINYARAVCLCATS